MTSLSIVIDHGIRVYPMFNTWVSLSLLHTGYKDRHCRNIQEFISSVWIESWIFLFKLWLFCLFGRYHLGTIAFGSLIIAIIKLIRLILEYIEMKLKGQTNKVVTYIIKCLQCCFWCLEKFMKFINKNAYIMVSLVSGNLLFEERVFYFRSNWK